MNRVRAVCRVVLAGLSLTGIIVVGSCTAAPGPDTQEGVPPITTATVQENASVQYYPSDEPLRLGLEHFNRGNFGVAEKYFRDAVEKAPKDASAWIGLAASYDRWDALISPTALTNQPYIWWGKQPPFSTIGAIPICCAATWLQRAGIFSRPWNENLAIRLSSTTLNFSMEVSGL